MSLTDDEPDIPCVVGVNLSADGLRRVRSPATGATWQAMVRYSMRALRRGALPDEPFAAPGAEALAVWRRRGYGSLLFRLDATDSDLPFQSVLHTVDGRRRGPWWVCTGGGGGGHHDEPPPERGLQWLGDGGDDAYRQLTGRACGNTVAIQLADGERTWTEPVGRDGFVLLGALAADSTLSAVAVDADGRPLGGPLWV
jgi:hypothetical protein